MEQNINALYHKFLMQQCSIDEAEWLMEYFSTPEGKEHLARMIALEFDAMPTAMPTDQSTLLSVKIGRSTLKNIIFERKPFPFRLLSYAAVLFMIVAVSFFLLHSYEDPAEVIMSASSKAVLTLPNGDKIELSSEKNEISLQDNTIRYEDGTKVRNGLNARSAQFVSLTTPRGGLYRLVLSDGSKVWLNTATALRYPLKFTGKQRLVELDGEAYFEVAEDKHRPFLVKSKGQQIKVLGTAFNVSAFSTEPETRTTLIRGAVELSNSQYTIKLSPAEEAILTKQSFSTRKVDPTQAIAWIDGNFSFDDESLVSIMNKISRWYDVEITYQNVDQEARFFGGISQYDNLQTVLNRLEKTGGIHFKLTGRRVIVMK
ncbi:FecR family protein [Pedobacter sp. GR22-6]|uniref:FecR family protein n=1 Tax=Pedobacter sp. GR22-6 TaxID=3127957 RepID=UPI00307D9961